MVSCSLLETLVSWAKYITNIITQQVWEEYNKFKELCKCENLRANHESDVNIACTYEDAIVSQENETTLNLALVV